MADQARWEDYGPAEFDRRRMPRKHKQAPEGQAGLFRMCAEPLPEFRPWQPPELPGQDALFTGSECGEYQ